LEMDKKELSILLIEDDEDDVLVVREMCSEAVARDMHISLVTAATLREGLECIDRNSVDMILLDLFLPDSRGLATIEMLQKRNTGIPVVVLTGQDDEWTGIEAVKKGAQDFLVKGKVDNSLFIRVIKYAFERNQLLQEHISTLERLRESEENYRSLFQDSPIALCELDCSDKKRYINALRDNGIENFQVYFLNNPEEMMKLAEYTRVINVNNHAVRLFQAGSREALKRDFCAFLFDESYDICMEELIAISQGRGSFEIEASCRTMKGRRLSISVNWIVPAAWQESCSRVILSILDITEQKRLHNELMKRNRELENFSNHLSHNIKNNLLLIKRVIDLAEIRPEYLFQNSRLMADSAESLILYINKLLKLARSGKVISEKTDVQLVPVITELFSRIRPPEIEAEITFQDSFPLVQGDPLVLEQLFLNLLGNSLQYRDLKKPVLTVNLGYSEKENGIEIIYRDNGSGIDRDRLEHIFDEGVTSSEESHLGIGLAIVKRIVEAHGGSVYAKSEGIDTGVEFIMFFPSSPRTDSDPVSMGEAFAGTIRTGL